MSLFVVATPIGNNDDFTVRALEVLRSADVIIGEELKVLRQTLKAAGVQAKAMDQLNEHSDARDVAALVELCRVQKVALVSDCGTPGFCDPGADLVAAAVAAGIEVRCVPGASSMMALLSVAGVRVDRFFFFGFLPPKTEARAAAWREIKASRVPVIVMETPYRAGKFMDELKAAVPASRCVVGLNLTQESERVLRGVARALPAVGEDAELICLVVPAG
jgi:16S rRNA (cytidine1402-2'-O)-methyltransferase